MDPFEAAAAQVARQAKAPVDVAWIPLASKEPGRVAAVDGSHAVLLDNGRVHVIAVQAGAPGHVPSALRLVAGQGMEAVEVAWRGVGLEAPPVKGAEGIAEAIRGIHEAEVARQAIRSVGRGGMVLIDGALTGLPRQDQLLWDLVTADAETAGVTLFGISKRSKHALPPPPGIAVATQEVQVAHLHAAAPFTFRVDGPIEEMGRLVPLCRDAAFLGYPYPLVEAHRQMALTGPRAAALRRRLEVALRQAGPEAFRFAADPHGLLDRLV